MGDAPANSSFFSQLQQRKVFRVSVAYAVASFVLIQIGDATFESLPLPQPTMLWLLAAMFVLYPVVVTVAWLFEITPGGVVFDRRFARLPRTVEALFLVSITLVSLGIAGWLILNAQGDRPRRSTIGGVPTIAVLPFQDFSPAQNSAYIGNGIAEQLLTALHGLREFQLVGRTSTFYWAGKDLDLRDVARRLGVDHIVEGSVQVHDSRVLVTAQLIETDSMLHVWAQTYERQLGDLIGLELEIARSIADSMQIALSGQSRASLADVPRHDSGAYVLYLQGREYLRRPAERQTLEVAESLFERALAAEPGFAGASVGLCQTRLALYRVTELTEAHRLALETCLKIVGDAPQDAEGYVALGDLNRMVGNYAQAESMFRQALDRDPRSLSAHHGLARSYQGQGRLDAAEAEFRRVIEIDPSDWSGFRGYGLFLAQQGRFAEAARHFQRAVELTPDDANAFSNLGLAQFEAGNWVEAKAAWEHALTLRRTEPLLYNMATLRYYSGEYQEALELLREIEASGHADFRTLGKMGACQRQLGEPDAARDAFERAIALAQERLSTTGAEPWVQAYLASYHASLGAFDEARQLIDTARQAAPGDPDVNYFDAVVESLAGGPGVAEALARARSAGYPALLLDADPLFANAALNRESTP